MLVSLLQPPPETFALFDDVILLAEGVCVPPWTARVRACLVVAVSQQVYCSVWECNLIVVRRFSSPWACMHANPCECELMLASPFACALNGILQACAPRSSSNVQSVTAPPRCFAIFTTIAPLTTQH